MTGELPRDDLSLLAGDLSALGDDPDVAALLAETEHLADSLRQRGGRDTAARAWQRARRRRRELDRWRGRAMQDDDL